MIMVACTVREENEHDIEDIRTLNLSVFRDHAQADLIDNLRNAGALTVSLVAHVDSALVGHIAFSPIALEHDDGTRRFGFGLGPMAVHPKVQHRGVGSLLVERGLDLLRALDGDLCVVMGHPNYYPRFGFVPASRVGLRWEVVCPDEAFMAIELKSRERKPALVRLHAAFKGLV